MSKEVVLLPRKHENLSPRDFVALDERAKANIATVRFVPPRLGAKGYGYFAVSYKRPIYKV